MKSMPQVSTPTSLFLERVSYIYGLPVLIILICLGLPLLRCDRRSLTGYASKRHYSANIQSIPIPKLTYIDAQLSIERRRHSSRSLNRAMAHHPPAVLLTLIQEVPRSRPRRGPNKQSHRSPHRARKLLSSHRARPPELETHRRRIRPREPSR